MDGSRLARCRACRLLTSEYSLRLLPSLFKGSVPTYGVQPGLLAKVWHVRRRKELAPSATGSRFARCRAYRLPDSELSPRLLTPPSCEEEAPYASSQAAPLSELQPACRLRAFALICGSRHHPLPGSPPAHFRTFAGPFKVLPLVLRGPCRTPTNLSFPVYGGELLTSSLGRSAPT
jgi:hypothetical protein